MRDPNDTPTTVEDRREHRRLRIRRHGRRAMIRSIYSLPSLATLGNAVCGFGAMYVASLDAKSIDPLAQYFLGRNFEIAAYLIFAAMVFDALDGRLARFARHTTDFGGQLDSLADVISFGAAPAFLALLVFKAHFPWSDDSPLGVTRAVWAIGALYMSCAAIRLARFNVSNEHGEQAHFSFLGLPSPGAGAAVAAFVLMQQDLHHQAIVHNSAVLSAMSQACVYALPVVVCGTGLLMVSAIRYPHLVNRYLRGRRSFVRVIGVFVILLLLVVAHKYTIAIGSLLYAFGALGMWAYNRARRTSSAVASLPSSDQPK